MRRTRGLRRRVLRERAPQSAALRSARSLAPYAWLRTEAPSLGLNLYKRGKKGTYWFDEVINGLRVRQSLRTSNWQAAQHAAKQLLAETIANLLRGTAYLDHDWSDIDWQHELVTVRKSKTDAGERSIPLVPDAIAALQELRNRASAFSTPLPSHYVFGTCEHGHYDPARPMASWRTAWRNLTTAIVPQLWPAAAANFGLSPRQMRHGHEGRGEPASRFEIS